MTSPDHYVHAKFGIDEIYIHKGFTPDLLEKLHRWAELSLDAEDNIVLKHASHDMILIFNKKIPTQNIIYRFLKYFDQDIVDKEDFIKSNTLLNEEELLSAIKSKKFVLITHHILLKETVQGNIDQG